MCHFINCNNVYGSKVVAHTNNAFMVQIFFHYKITSIVHFVDKNNNKLNLLL